MSVCIGTNLVHDEWSRNTVTWSLNYEKPKYCSEALFHLGKLLCCYMALALGHGAHTVSTVLDACFQTIGCWPRSGSILPMIDYFAHSKWLIPDNIVRHFHTHSSWQLLYSIQSQSLIRIRVLATPRELEEHQRKINPARTCSKHPRARNRLEHLVRTIDYIPPSKVHATHWIHDFRE